MESRPPQELDLANYVDFKAERCRENVTKRTKIVYVFLNVIPVNVKRFYSNLPLERIEKYKIL